MVILDTQELYEGLKNNQYLRLNDVQVKELFHQIFERMHFDKLTYLHNITNGPSFERVFARPQDIDCLDQLTEIWLKTALTSFFMVEEYNLFDDHHTVDNKVFNYFILNITSQSVMLMPDGQAGVINDKLLNPLNF